MKLKTTFGILGVVATLCLGGGHLLAQDDNGRGPGGPGGGPPPGDFDPAQFHQRMLGHIRTNLSISNDSEWAAIQPLVQKVMDVRREAEMGMRGPGGPGGGPPFGRQPSAEQKALQKAIDEKAPAAQIKDALTKFRSARKDKQAKLESAQAELKSVLSTEQEAQAVLMGLVP
jgi:hypothetical protein